MKRNKKAIILTFFMCAGLALGGCKASENDAAEDGGKLIVAAAIVPEQTFIQKVCGDLVQVTVMIPPGFSPENYEPKPAQMEEFSDAAVYFAMGVPAEEQSILPSLSETTELVSLSDICREQFGELKIGQEGRDPHIWLSPKRAMLMVQTIADTMGRIDPENKATYESNAKAYIEEISTADEEIKTLLEPLQEKSFMVFHPAFGYFADEYSLTMYALEQEGKEVTAATLSSMIDLAREKGIRTIFYQAQTDGSRCEAFAQEIGGTAVMLDPLSPDYVENLRLMAAAIAEGAK